MRRLTQRDPSHEAIVDGLRAALYTVLDLGSVGGGCPDILVGGPGCNVLMEIKEALGPMGGASRKNQRLNTEQLKFHHRWRGPIYTVRSLEKALEIMEMMGD